MNPLVRLASMTMPGCGYAGAQGQPMPPPTDPAATIRPATAGTALTDPKSVKPIRGIVIPPCCAPPGCRVFPDQAVAASQPRTCEAANCPNSNQVGHAVRSPAFNVSNPTMVRAVPNQSDMILWSGSVYDKSDFRGIHERLTTWIAALQAQLPHSREK